MQDNFAKEQAKRQKETYDLLVQLGGNKVTEESGILYHGNGQQILLPQGMTKATAAKLLAAAALNEETEHDFVHVFKFRPWDGANALNETLRTLFGTSGEGMAQQTMFGPVPPKKITIETGVNQEKTVPWGLISFPLLEAVIATGQSWDDTYGMLFQMTVTAPKKHGSAVEGLFKAIEQTLREKSIYKGKVFVASEKPAFFDPYRVQKEKVVYAEDVFGRLESSVWGPIRTADVQRAEGVALNTKTILHGPYGTGKTLAGALTAQVATENGWTFLQAHTGKDDLNQVMQTAALYSPAVVFIEDIDVLAKVGENADDNSKLLELFDGISVKNNEVMVVMTSNRAAEMHKGMLRAGRIDAAIEIGALDEPGVERLIRVSIDPSRLEDDIDFGPVHVAMEGYEPAFIKETFVSAQRAAISRVGKADYKLSGQDFVNAANLLRPQFELHSHAKEGKDKGTPFEEALRRLLAHELESHKVDYDEDNRLTRVAS